MDYFEYSLTSVSNYYFGCGEYLQKQWEVLYDYYEGDAHSLAVYPRMFFAFPTAIMYAVPFIIADAFKLAEHKKFKPRYYPSINDYMKCVATLFFNLTIINFFVGEAFFAWSKLTNFQYSRNLPTLPKALFDLLVSLFAQEFTVYPIHRIMHAKWLYSWVHKKHHEFVFPFSLAGLYLTPSEFFILALNGYFPMLMTGGHIFTLYLAEVLGFFGITTQHCAYHFRIMPFGRCTILDHFYHHQKFNYEYGCTGLLDSIFQTQYKNRKDNEEFKED